MDIHRIAAALRSLSASPSRRGVVALLAGAVVGGMPGLRAVSGAPKKKGKRKGKKKKKRRDEPTLAPPPVPGPVPVSTYQCPGPPEFLASPAMPGTTRFVQLFTATRSGTLQEIQFQINKGNNSTGNFLVELLEAANDLPTNTVLAALSIANSSVPTGATTLKASFNGPQLAAGTQYAAAISRPGGNNLEVSQRLGNDCTGLPFGQTPSGATFSQFTTNNPSFITSVIVLP